MHSSIGRATSGRLAGAVDGLLETRVAPTLTEPAERTVVGALSLSAPSPASAVPSAWTPGGTVAEWRPTAGGRAVQPFHSAGGRSVLSDTSAVRSADWRRTAGLPQPYWGMSALGGRVTGRPSSGRGPRRASTGVVGTSGRRYARFRDPSGAQVVKVFDRKVDAERHLAAGTQVGPTVDRRRDGLVRCACRSPPPRHGAEAGQARLWNRPPVGPLRAEGYLGGSGRATLVHEHRGR